MGDIQVNPPREMHRPSPSLVFLILVVSIFALLKQTALADVESHSSNNKFLEDELRSQTIEDLLLNDDYDDEYDDEDTPKENKEVSSEAQLCVVKNSNSEQSDDDKTSLQAGSTLQILRGHRGRVIVSKLHSRHRRHHHRLSSRRHLHRRCVKWARRRVAIRRFRHYLHRLTTWKGSKTTVEYYAYFKRVQKYFVRTMRAKLTTKQKVELKRSLRILPAKQTAVLFIKSKLPLSKVKRFISKSTIRTIKVVKRREVRWIRYIRTYIIKLKEGKAISSSAQLKLLKYTALVPASKLRKLVVHYHLSPLKMTSVMPRQFAAKFVKKVQREKEAKRYFKLIFSGMTLSTADTKVARHFMSFMRWRVISRWCSHSFKCRNNAKKASRMLLNVVKPSVVKHALKVVRKQVKKATLFKSFVTVLGRKKELTGKARKQIVTLFRSWSSVKISRYIVRYHIRLAAIAPYVSTKRIDKMQKIERKIIRKEKRTRRIIKLIRTGKVSLRQTRKVEKVLRRMSVVRLFRWYHRGWITLSVLQKVAPPKKVQKLITFRFSYKKAVSRLRHYARIIRNGHEVTLVLIKRFRHLVHQVSQRKLVTILSQFKLPRRKLEILVKPTVIKSVVRFEHTAKKKAKKLVFIFRGLGDKPIPRKQRYVVRRMLQSFSRSRIIWYIKRYHLTSRQLSGVMPRSYIKRLKDTASVCRTYSRLIKRGRGGITGSVRGKGSEGHSKSLI